ncbi:MAG TPA: radical SAM protein, partial [Roseiarcus sp.]|nr:radical SAM protein [Roseiarcus sp.]
LLDRVIKLKDEGIHCGFTIQVDTLCHKIPNFIEKATKAGARRIFIGLENINPDNLIAAKKRQNKITEYRAMLQKWRAHGALTFAGYILGFPADTKESILRDVEIIKRELPLDILEFFFLTPLPGSEDHKSLLKKGVWMDPDINKYDLDHRVSHHTKMSDAEWEEAYRAAWDVYYTPEHIRTILKRAAQIPNGRPKPIASTIMWFKLMIEQEGVHPLEGGAFRLKYRRDRRHGLPVESPFVFYPRYWGGIAVKAWKYSRFFLNTRRILKEVLEAPDRWTYTDLAIAPPKADEFEQLELYHATTGGEAALARMKLGDDIRASVPAAAAE